MGVSQITMLVLLCVIDVVLGSAIVLVFVVSEFMELVTGIFESVMELGVVLCVVFEFVGGMGSGGSQITMLVLLCVIDVVLGSAIVLVFVVSEFMELVTGIFESVMELGVVLCVVFEFFDVVSDWFVGIMELGLVFDIFLIGVEVLFVSDVFLPRGRSHPAR